jgi:hypothetical protein
VETEKNTRVEREVVILGKLSEEIFKVQQLLKSEKDERNLKLKDMKDHVNHEITSQTKYN